MDLNTKSEIVEYLERMIVELSPNAKMREMYGGIVIETVAGDPKTRIGGFYVYDNYITVEFADGYRLEDPNGLLEGKGKKRRHLKLQSLEDVSAKKLPDFISQAFNK